MRLVPNKKEIFTIGGFLLFFYGIMTLATQLVGVYIWGFAWIDNWGGLTGFLIRISMVLAGLTILMITRGNFEGRD